MPDAPTTQAEQEDAVRADLIAFFQDRYWQVPRLIVDEVDALLAGPLATLRARAAAAETERDEARQRADDLFWTITEPAKAARHWQMKATAAEAQRDQFAADLRKAREERDAAVRLDAPERTLDPQWGMDAFRAVLGDKYTPKVWGKHRALHHSSLKYVMGLDGLPDEVRDVVASLIWDCGIAGNRAKFAFEELFAIRSQLVAAEDEATALRSDLRKAREEMRQECLKATLGASYGPPSSWPGDYPNGWRHPPSWEPDEKPTPTIAAWHDNGARDAWFAIRALDQHRLTKNEGGGDA